MLSGWLDSHTECVRVQFIDPHNSHTGQARLSKCFYSPTFKRLLGGEYPFPFETWDGLTLEDFLSLLSRIELDAATK